MIKIVNTNDKNLKRNYNNEWRNSTNTGIADKIDDNSLCKTPQSDVDAIASMMDEQPKEEIDTPNNISNAELTMSPMERDIQNMMQNYIKQNGAVVQDDNKVKKNQTLFG